MRLLLAALVLLLGLTWAAVPPHALAEEPRGVPVSQTDDAPSATPQQLSVLQEILNRAEFRAAEGRSYLDRLLDPMRAWVRWLIGALLRLIVGGIEAGGQLLPLLVVGAAAFVLIVVAFVLRRLLRGSLTSEASIAEAARSGPPRASEELARARALAAAGDPRGAVHHHYRAVLLRLDERDHLSYDGTLTNQELLPRLTAAPELAQPFGELVGQFDRLWYGQPSCSQEEYEAFASLADRVWRVADAVSPPRAVSHETAHQPAAVGAAGGPR